MPKRARPIQEYWANIRQVLAIPDGIYNLVNDNYLHCTYCTSNLHHVTETNVRRHHFSKLHQQNTELQAADAEPTDEPKAECFSRTHAFYYDQQAC